MTETATPHPEPKLSLEEYRRRNAELQMARNGKVGDLSDKIDRWLQKSLPGHIQRHRETIADDERRAEQNKHRNDPRIELENLLYLNGDIDQHSAVHGTPSLVKITAAELCGKHLGWKFHGELYRDKNKTSGPTRKGTFTVETISHLKNGAILINGSYPYLRPDTVLAVVARPMSDIQAAAHM